MKATCDVEEQHAIQVAFHRNSRKPGLAAGLVRRGIEPQMNTKPYTDAELDALKSMPKRVTNPGARWSEKPKSKPGHRQRIFQAYGQGDQQDRFSIYMRQNLSDESDFFLRDLIPPAWQPIPDAGSLQRTKPRARRHHLPFPYSHRYREGHRCW